MRVYARLFLDSHALPHAWQCQGKGPPRLPVPGATGSGLRLRRQESAISEWELDPSILVTGLLISSLSNMSNSLEEVGSQNSSDVCCT